MKRLEGNVTIITGGGKGIGYGLAEAFAREGSNLVITGRTLSRLESAKERLEAAYGVEVLPIVADGADEEAIKRRMQSQMSEQELLQRADKVVYNDGSRSLIGQLWQLLSNM